MGAKRSAAMTKALQKVLAGQMSAAEAARRFELTKGAISKTPEYIAYRQEQKAK